MVTVVGQGAVFSWHPLKPHPVTSCKVKAALLLLWLEGWAADKLSLTYSVLALS